MDVLKQLSLWLSEENIKIETKEQLAVYLSELSIRLKDNPDLFEEIMEAEGDENSEVLDLAKMLQLLNNEDEFYQEQGIELLLSYDSEEAWEALMTGASFDFWIKHSSLKMSQTLRRILLQNPYYNYSHVQRLFLETPFADELSCLEYLQDLEELHLRFQRGGLESNIFRSLQGLEKLSKLRKLTIEVKQGSKPDSFLKNEWLSYMQNIEELEFLGGVKLNYSFVDSLPNLKKIYFKDISISYDGALFKHQPELHMYSFDRDVSHVLPPKSRKLQIAKLHLRSKAWTSVHYDLSFLSRVQVDMLVLENVPNIKGISVFAELSKQPEIQCIDFYSRSQSTWDDETLQSVGAEGLQEFLENKEQRLARIQKIQDQEKLVLHAEKQGHIDIRGVKATQVQFIFPDEDHRSSTRRIRKLRHLYFLPQAVQKVQFGEAGQTHGNWLEHLDRLETYKELEEIVFYNLQALSLKKLIPLATLPKLEKILLIGGKTYKRIPKEIRHLYEQRE